MTIAKLVKDVPRLDVPDSYGLVITPTNDFGRISLNGTNKAAMAPEGSHFFASVLREDSDNVITASSHHQLTRDIDTGNSSWVITNGTNALSCRQTPESDRSIAGSRGYYVVFDMHRIDRRSMTFQNFAQNVFWVRYYRIIRTRWVGWFRFRAKFPDASGGIS